MEQILLNLAEASPVALVSIYAIWRISIVLIELTKALTVISERLADFCHDKETETPQPRSNSLRAQILEPSSER